MGSKDKRVSKLEKDTGGGRDEIRVSVNWENDDLVLDHASGERVTPAEWKRRNPKNRLILVGWDDDDDEQSEPVPA